MLLHIIPVISLSAQNFTLQLNMILHYVIETPNLMTCFLASFTEVAVKSEIYR